MRVERYIFVKERIKEEKENLEILNNLLNRDSKNLTYEEICVLRSVRNLLINYIKDYEEELE